MGSNNTLTNRQLQTILNKLNDLPNVPFRHAHATFLFIGSQLICVSQNDVKKKTHARLTKSAFSCHSEIGCLVMMERMALKPSKKMKLVTVGYNKEYLKNGQPCKHCCDALQKYGFDEIIYTDRSGNFVKNKLDNIHSILSSGDLHFLAALQ